MWERLHYDWSDPTRIVITDTDSDVWGGRSGYVYTLTARPDGRTDIDEVVTRDGKPQRPQHRLRPRHRHRQAHLRKGPTGTVKAIEARTTTTAQAANPRHHPATRRIPNIRLRGTALAAPTQSSDEANQRS